MEPIRKDVFAEEKAKESAHIQEEQAETQERIANALEKEAKTNVVEKALTDKDTEVSPNDAATIEFNLKEINI